MRIRFLMLSVLGALLLAGGRGWSQDKDGARALLDKAIEAHGSVDNLKKWTAVSFKSTGKTFLKGGEVITQTAETREDGTERYYSRLEGKQGEKTLLDIIVLEEDRGWLKRDEEDTRKLNPAEKRFLQEDRYFSSVTKLLPLRDPAFKLVELAEEVKVGDRAALGIQVKKAGQPDVVLYFDKTTSLVVKGKVTKKMGDKEYLEEFFYSDHKEKDGSTLARKVAIWKDGKLDSEWAITDVRLGQSFEPAAFAKP